MEGATGRIGNHARLGLRGVPVQQRWVDWPEAIYDKPGDSLLSQIMGAGVRRDPSGVDIGFHDSWEQALTSVEEQGGQACDSAAIRSSRAAVNPAGPDSEPDPTCG